MSEAHPGEVLVSAVMKDLVPASGFTFADRGVHTLKGIDGEWRLFAVTAVDGSQRPPPVEPEEAAHLRQEIQPLPIVQRRAGRLGIAAVALLVAVVATGAAFAFAHRPRPIVVQPNSLVKIDPTSNEVAADVPLAVQPGTSQITAVPPDRIWVMSQLDQVIAVVDTNSNSQVKVCPGIRGQEANTPGVQVAGEGIVYADGSVWASGPQNKLDLLEPSTCEPGSPVALEGTPDLLSEGYGRVWVVSHDIMRVYAVDPTSGSVKPTARIGVDDSGVAVGEGAVWVSNGGDGTISKIDPQTGTTTPIPIWYRRTVNGTKERMQAFPSGIGTAFSSVWLADAPNAVVYRIDPATNKIIDTIQIGQPTDPQFIWLSTIVAADGSLWVTSPASKAIVRIDPTTDRVTNSISVPYTPRSLVSANGSVWVTVEAE
jgi:streptogramin lyase